MSRLQEGPQCGIVALSMADQQVSVEQVQEVARVRGYTKQGEMFSVDNMAELGRSVLDRDVSVESSDTLRDTE